MRVMYLSPSGELGGAEQLLADMVSAVRASHPDWALHVVTAADGPLVGRFATLDVETTVLPFPRALASVGESANGSRWRSPARAAAALPAAGLYTRRLRDLLRRTSPDIVHSNGLKMHLAAAAASTRPAALVWHLHDYVSPRRFSARLLRLASRHASIAVANSVSVAEDAQAVLGPRVRVVPVHNGIDLNRFTPAGPRHDLDALAGLEPAPPTAVRVGLLGAFGRWKGHKTFLNALARLPKTLDVRGYVIGGPVYQTDGSQFTIEELRQFASALGLSGRVGFTGFVDSPERALRALDIVVHASTEPEPFGLVIVEALAAARAAVVSAAGGALEIVTPDVNALTHMPGDPDSLAEAIARLAADPDARVRLGRAGRAMVEQRFDRARLGGQLSEVYREAAGR
jgi:glycosyltransferase involved in cell wall biosynthesis